MGELWNYLIDKGGLLGVLLVGMIVAYIKKDRDLQKEREARLDDTKEMLERRFKADEEIAQAMNNLSKWFQGR